jgi:release factor glutamine methyltransferase
VEHAIGAIKLPAGVLDIGSGSGIISILLAKHTNARVTAVENSKKALRVLKKNIALHNVGDRVTPICADLFPRPVKEFQMIVSNPPYVSEAEWRELDPTVRDYEPKAALTAGEEGLAIIRQIIKGSPLFLEPGGKLLIEIGYNQKQRVGDILAENGFSSIDFFNDYSHIPRVAYGELPI